MNIDDRKYAPIGVFDSGVGGLTVAREIMRQLPKEDIVYFGDTARVPYGSKSKDNIIRYSRQIVRFLQTKDVKAIVIACNTASALALDIVRNETDIPVLGVVENYSYLECPDCKKRINVFGESHIEEVAEELEIPVLGKMPIDTKLAEYVEAERFWQVENEYLAGVEAYLK